MAFRSLEGIIRDVVTEAAMSRDEKAAVTRALLLNKQGKKKELKDFMMAMDSSLRSRVKKQLGENFILEQEDDQPASPDEHSMAKAQLKFVKYAAEEIEEYIDSGAGFPEWFQNKLTKLHELSKDLHAYMEGENNKESEDD